MTFDNSALRWISVSSNTAANKKTVNRFYADFLFS